MCLYVNWAKTNTAVISFKCREAELFWGLSVLSLRSGGLTLLPFPISQAATHRVAMLRTQKPNSILSYPITDLRPLNNIYYVFLLLETVRYVWFPLRRCYVTPAHWEKVLFTVYGVSRKDVRTSCNEPVVDWNSEQEVQIARGLLWDFFFSGRVLKVWDFIMAAQLVCDSVI